MTKHKNLGRSNSSPLIITLLCFLGMQGINVKAHAQINLRPLVYSFTYSNSGKKSITEIREKITTCTNYISSQVIPDDEFTELVTMGFHFEFWRDSSYAFNINSYRKEALFLYGPWMDTTCVKRTGYHIWSSPRNERGDKPPIRIGDSTRMIAGHTCVLYKRDITSQNPFKGRDVPMTARYWVAEHLRMPFDKVGDIPVPLTLEGVAGVVLAWSETAKFQDTVFEAICTGIEEQAEAPPRYIIPPWPRIPACSKQ